MGKGSWRRPYDQKKFEEAWDKIFSGGSRERHEPVSFTSGEYRPAPVPSAEGSDEEPVTDSCWDGGEHEFDFDYYKVYCKRCGTGG